MRDARRQEREDLRRVDCDAGVRDLLGHVRRVRPRGPGILDVQHLAVAIDLHVSQRGQPVTHERRRVARREMLLDQPREIDVEQDVGVVDDEGAARQERFSVLERAARAEDRVLGKEGDPVAPARRPGPGTQ